MMPDLILFVPVYIIVATVTHRQLRLWERLLFAVLVFAALGCLGGGGGTDGFSAFSVQPETITVGGQATLTIETGVPSWYGTFSAYGGVPPEALGRIEVFDMKMILGLPNPMVDLAPRGVKLPILEERTKEHRRVEMVVRVPADIRSGLVVVEAVRVPGQGEPSQRWLLTNARHGYLEVRR